MRCCEEEGEADAVVGVDGRWCWIGGHVLDFCADFDEKLLRSQCRTTQLRL